MHSASCYIYHENIWNFHVTIQNQKNWVCSQPKNWYFSFEQKTLFVTQFTVSVKTRMQSLVLSSKKCGIICIFENILWHITMLEIINSANTIKRESLMPVLFCTRDLLMDNIADSWAISLLLVSVADPGFAKRRGCGGPWRARWAPAGSSGIAPVGGQGALPWSWNQSSWWGQGATPWSWKLYDHFHTKIGQKLSI